MRDLGNVGFLLATLGVAVALTGCAAAPRVDAGVIAGAQSEFYVVRRAGHTGIVVPAVSWPNEALRAAFPGAQYLEFGWGDAAYYPAQRKNVLMTLDAVFTPSASVMSVLGLPDMTAAQADSIEQVSASPEELQALVASIASSFADFEPTGATRPTAGRELHFYPARGRFYFFRMCNQWTVSQLRAAGCEVGSLPVITAGRALREARRCATARASHQSSR